MAGRVEGLAVMLLLGVALAGCGGDGGEPIEGTVTIDWGTDHVVPTVGAAIENTEVTDAEEMLVFIGTRDIDCGTNLESPIRPGTYTLFSVDRTAPGMHSTAVTVMRVETGSAHFNSAGGEVQIDAIGEERVTGEFMVETTDDEAGPVAAGGTFDVIRCF